MEKIKIENLSFSYPKKTLNTLEDINLTIKSGEFVTICGKSGCGKTTLLRMLKPALSPVGQCSGTVYFNGMPLSDCDKKTQAAQIGFVMQSCDNQIVTDKVWHELAFGAESLGMSTPEIRSKVSEMASFFGIQTWFHKNVRELSGGQKQLLNLASVMVTSPEVLILDEPTGQLDPIAAQEFLNMLEKINRELGTTVILAEHRCEDTFPISDRVIVMDSGKIIADSTPENIGKILKNINHDMYSAMPTPIKVSLAVNFNGKCPITIREGRSMLEKFAKSNDLFTDFPIKSQHSSTETVLEMKDIWFRYDKNSPDIIKGLNFKAKCGELFAIVGGNGTGKTTMLSLLSGINTPYRGKIKINGKNITDIKNYPAGTVAMLPQNPQSIFVKNTVYADLEEMLSGSLSKDERAQKIQEVSSLCHIENLLESHPYDLSGGEQQRAAFAKILLTSPEILLLDEPTKGLDAHFKSEFANILKSLLASETTIIMVSHDIEFCAEHANRCAMFFDGNITSIGDARTFFTGKNFYTTSANRMARTVIPNAVLSSDIIFACTGNKNINSDSFPILNASDTMNNRKAIENITFGTENSCSSDNTECNIRTNTDKHEKRENEKCSTSLGKNANTHTNSGGFTQSHKLLSRILGIIFTLLFLVSLIISKNTQFTFINNEQLQAISIILLFMALLLLIPQKNTDIESVNQKKYKLTKRTALSFISILFLIPLTVYAGVYLLDDRKYYFISLMVIFETMLPFFVSFEKRKPKAREIVTISVLCAIAIAGRTAFFMLPQFKPVIAVVIISGVCFGGETGFLVGAVSGFVSNFFFGQGPWTPWQMFAFGAVGFLAGILFKTGILKRNRLSLCIFGFMATMIIYGGIMNPASVITWQKDFTWSMILSSYVMGIPFDLIHALSSAFFLWFISEPMIEKLERVKAKYGIADE